MDTYKVWERGIYESKDIEASSIFHAVREFTKVNVIPLTTMTWLTTKNNPARFIAEDGSAREFTAYVIRN